MTAQQKLDQMKQSRTWARYKKAFVGWNDVLLYNKILHDMKHNQLK